MKKELLVIRPLNKVYFGLCAVFLVLCIVLCKVMNFMADPSRLTMMRWLSGILASTMILYKIYLAFDKEYERIYYKGGKFNVWNELIFYPCNVRIILECIGLFTMNRLLLSFAFFFGWFGFIGLIFPPEGFDHYSLLKPRIAAFYFYHLMIIVMSVLLVHSHAFIPQFSDILPSLGVYTICSLTAMCINLFFRKTGLNPKSNYFYNLGPDGNVVLEATYKLIPYPFLYVLPYYPACMLVQVVELLLSRLYM